MARSRPHPLLLNRPLRRPETDLRVGAVAERLVRRSPAPAERDGSALCAELVALGVDEHDRPLYQVRPVVESGDLRLFGHDRPPLVSGAESVSHVPSDAPYPFRPNLVSSPTLMAAATTCMRAVLFAAEDPVAPAKAMGTNERSKPPAATPQKTRIG